MADRSRLFKTHAVVLRRRDYGDADRILSVYTPDHGKRDLIAHGVRKPTSRKAGHLETFTHASLLIADGRTWGVIREAATVESFRHIRQDLDQIGRASYICELVDRFTEVDDENRAIWDLLTGSLRALDANAISDRADPYLLLRWFELHLLSHTGFQPQFFHCLECGKPIEPVTNFVSLHDGGIVCPVCARSVHNLEPIQLDVLKVLRHLQRSRWEDVNTLRIGEPVMRQVDNLLHRYLIIVLERRLVSADFMRRLQALSDRTPLPNPAASSGQD